MLGDDDDDEEDSGCEDKDERDAIVETGHGVETERNVSGECAGEGAQGGGS